MNGYPIEKQVCTLEQAKELAGLLGDDAPRSLWIYSRGQGGMETPSLELRENLEWDINYIKSSYPAYTGDELGVLLPSDAADGAIMHAKSDTRKPFFSGYQDPEFYKMSVMKIADTEAQAKAALAIQGLKECWIKKEDFRYEN